MLMRLSKSNVPLFNSVKLYVLLLWWNMGRDSYSFNSKRAVFHWARQHLPKKLQYLHPISFCAMSMLPPRWAANYTENSLNRNRATVRFCVCYQCDYIDQTFLAAHRLEFPRAYYGASACICTDPIISFVSYTVRDSVIVEGLKINHLQKKKKKDSL